MDTSLSRSGSGHPRHPPGLRPAVVALATSLALAGCAASYDLTLMPRSSGTLYHGQAAETGGGQASVMVQIGERVYVGSWVLAVPEQGYGYVSGTGGWRRGGIGTTLTYDTPGGGLAKALLQASDGSGLRCDFHGLSGGFGAGTCTDDQGTIFDVQIRSREAR